MHKRALLALAVAAAVAGCESTTEPGQGLAPDEIAELSNALIQDGLSETADTVTTAVDPADEGLALDTYTWTFEFTRTHDCRLGGEVSVDGIRERTRDTETRTGAMDFVTTRTFDGCARPLADSTIITLDGAVTMTVHREWQAGSWLGLQEVTLIGTLDWATDDDRSGTCDVDIEASFDPETRTRTVSGSFCSEDIGAFRRWSWTFGPQHGPGHHEPGPHDGTG